MKQYDKPALSTAEQAELLIKRGLTGILKEDLEKILTIINYYRIRGYSYCYQNKDSTFKDGSCWSYIYQDYINDIELRSLIFEALSFIEITVRTQLEYKMSLAHGSRWYENENLFHNQDNLKKDLDDLMGHWNRSREIFKKHYEGKYDNTLRPPAWMIFETTTFGTVSKFFSNLRVDLEAKNEIVNFFGFTKSSAKILVSWLQHLNLVRNICAHHSRLFSRSFVIKPMIPMRQPEKWVNQWPAHDRLFPSVCIITYLLDICAPDYDFRKKIKAVVSKFRTTQLPSMGFSPDWDKEPLFYQK